MNTWPEVPSPAGGGRGDTLEQQSGPRALGFKNGIDFFQPPLSRDKLGLLPQRITNACYLLFSLLSFIQLMNNISEYQYHLLDARHIVATGAAAHLFP